MTVESTVAETTPDQLELVLAAAAAARRPLAAQSPAQRHAQLVAVADLLDARADDLVPVAMAESHLPEARLRGELTRTTVQLRLFAEQARAGAWLDVRLDEADPGFGTGPRPDLRRMRTAIGVVLNFAASNFPFAFSVAGGDSAAALASGCPVVVKAHEGHPRLSRLTAALVTEALLDAGAPAGAFALVEGREVGVEALRDDRVDAATFTGSVPGGLFLAQVAASRPRPVPFYGELGSLNPVVVTPGAATARAQEVVDGFTASMTLGSGQFCTKPGLVLWPAAHPARDALAAAVGAARTGELLTPGITEAFRAGAQRLAEILPEAQLVAPHEQDGCPQPGLVVVDAATFTAHADLLASELFGPHAVVVEYDGEELWTVLDQLEGSLTAAVHAAPGAEEHELVLRLRDVLTDKAGRVLLDQWPTGVSVTPAQHHGGPFPATTSPLHTSVGSAAVERFLRPVSYQGFPEALLPEPLRSDNPWGVPQQHAPAGDWETWGR